MEIRERTVSSYNTPHTGFEYSEVVSAAREDIQRELQYLEASEERNRKGEEKSKKAEEPKSPRQQQTLRPPNHPPPPPPTAVPPLELYATVDAREDSSRSRETKKANGLKHKSPPPALAGKPGIAPKPRNLPNCSQSSPRSLTNSASTSSSPRSPRSPNSPQSANQRPSSPTSPSGPSSPTSRKPPKSPVDPVSTSSSPNSPTHPPAGTSKSPKRKAPVPTGPRSSAAPVSPRSPVALGPHSAPSPGMASSVHNGPKSPASPPPPPPPSQEEDPYAGIRRNSAAGRRTSSSSEADTKAPTRQSPAAIPESRQENATPADDDNEERDKELVEAMKKTFPPIPVIPFSSDSVDNSSVEVLRKMLVTSTRRPLSIKLGKGGEGVTQMKLQLRQVSEIVEEEEEGDDDVFSTAL